MINMVIEISVFFPNCHMAHLLFFYIHYLKFVPFFVLSWL